ncbi:CbtA family protein [Phyllobacterium endophyticum]|uniref:Cobalt transporter n=1 Tax=Phyllobacterium endophyticum TaxID=1149773 RepID=A0A2P7ATX2_9HYPH|nr:CbtA family protein [Phyllobacterium endophyticum]MBB3234082.1 cobalt transporter subunit CbtA [Phyllobacterium endophyticum]PSH57656.1 cobalt transporter [Phyllobacterium endophyticum]TXR51004.1 cobalt transporter [Phyllobacterium endophyticum]TYR43847.1 cobalt transporter [Phyllobacterium endophyticum]
MLVRYLLATIVAGLFAGILLTPAMYVRTVPLILHAEEYENAGGHEHSHDAAAAAVPHEHEEEASPALPFGRLGNTLLINLVAGAGFALMTGAAALFLGRRITLQNGIYWGLAGFFIFNLAPAFSLAPELPAMPAADLAARQAWWLVTVVLSAGGVYLIVLRNEIWARIAGVLLIVAPHVYGAPQAQNLNSAVPATLASEFAVSTLATNLFFWIVLGTALGWAIQQYAQSELDA